MTAADKQAGEKAVARAKGAGAVGPGNTGQLTSHELALRDSAIWLAFTGGMTQKAIAVEFGITVRSVQNVLKKVNESESPLDKAPRELLEELVRLVHRQALDFARTAQAHFERNPNVSLGAQKGAAEMTERYIRLLVATGKLPRNLTLFRAQSELEQLARLMATKTEEVRRGDITVDELADFLESVTNPASLWATPVPELPSGEAEAA